MFRLDRLLVFPSTVRAASAPGSRRLWDHPAVALGFLLALCLTSACLLSLARTPALGAQVLEGIGKGAPGAWQQAMTWSLASNSTPAAAAAGFEGPRESLLDFTIILAVLLGAATSYVFNYAWAAIRERRSGRAGPGGSGAVVPAEGGGSGGVGAQAFDNIPDNACYFCIRRAATSKCGSCRLVYYCCRLCQMQAWRKHRHVCGAAAAAATRIQRSRSLISPSQWRDLVDYCDFVKSLVPSATVVPTAPEMVAGILLRIGGYVRLRSDLVCQPMADAAWAFALSMRSEGSPDRLHMAWAWGFLEAAVESGSADAFLAALRINDAGAADLPRVNRWMKRGLCQALLMLNKRQEVGGFFRAAPMQQVLYF